MEQTLFVGIVVSDPLISHDIAGIFAFWRAGSVCRVFGSIDALRALPPNDFNPGLVFIAATRAGYLDVGPKDFLWLQQRAVITLDVKENTYFPHWRHLTRPFTQEQVIQAAQQLLKPEAVNQSRTG
ncbi:hypothetical protein ACOTTU_10245 [Roseobacter sp. EG26]|uniref:hypothetical protein n=1 Tax=Roseobacter sp. EG26 TaxID=3412477 RepID=UPI003CE4A18F